MAYLVTGLLRVARPVSGSDAAPRRACGTETAGKRSVLPSVVRTWRQWGKDPGTRVACAGDDLPLCQDQRFLYVISIILPSLPPGPGPYISNTSVRASVQREVMRAVWRCLLTGS
jgi:hypothetical protein